eukprot:NODE_1553_length_1463_cov_34.085329_g1473_i0.p1 GENE.NODE_1553_length_1463_cov_34.085329_g1473_i0~~NODE_1553_length_1463_cov_34.085329_g1473_i0.p1  ORF type:complete len:468 (-),score=116.12 NODE_1553_length_1463_cov_34.085329_g1473_i0:60-1424(-)
MSGSLERFHFFSVCGLFVAIVTACLKCPPHLPLLEYLLLRRVGCLALTYGVGLLLLTVSMMLQHLFLGELSTFEIHHCKSKGIFFVFKQFLFLLYTLQPHSIYEFCFWAGWFSLIVTLKILCEMAILRCAQVAQTTNPSPAVLKKLHGFLVLVFMWTLTVWVGASYAFLEAGLQPIIVILFEPTSILLELVQTMIKFMHYLHWLETEEPVDEKCFMADFLGELLRLGLSLAHHLHLLYLLLTTHREFSLASVLLWFHIPQLFRKLQTKVVGFRNYTKALRVIHQTYPSATSAQLQAYADPCAICYDVLEESGSSGFAAKVLPCDHIFHLRCIRQWMEHQNCCPICKRELLVPTTPVPTQTHRPASRVWSVGSSFQMMPRLTVEIRRIVVTPLPQAPQAPAPPEAEPPSQTQPQLSAAVQEVQEVLPHISAETIALALSRSRTTTEAINRLLERT